MNAKCPRCPHDPEHRVGTCGHYPPAVRYTAPYVMDRQPGERLLAWQCRCRRPDGRRLLRKHRHLEPWYCLEKTIVAAWRREHPQCTRPGTALALAWLAQEFGQHVRAR